MKTRRFLGLSTCILALAFAAATYAGIPNEDESYAIAVSEPDQVSCLICPAGGGRAFLQCRLFGGTMVNAMIELWVRDINGDPVVLYPASDLWVIFNGMCECPPPVPPHGCIADAPTDANGYTTFSGPFYAAGCSDDNSTNINMNGTIINQPGMPIWFNSPDMNCDLVVNLTDVVLLAQAFAVYDYCADYYWDAVINLSDVVEFAPHMAHTCP